MFSWQTHGVMKRNRDVYLKNWRTSLIPPLMEPFVNIFVFGCGLGKFVSAMTWRGASIDYLTYISAGILSMTVFNMAFFECLYGTYVRMFYQKSFDAILATRVEARHIVRGEILWGAVKATFNALCVMVSLSILQAMGWVHLRLWTIFAIIPLCLLGGVIFGAFALLFTASVPNIDHFNFPVFLVAIPLTLTSNTYFPIDQLHPLFQGLSLLNPLYHLTEFIRDLLCGSGIPWGGGVTTLGVLLLYGAVLIPLAERWMGRRILGE